MSADNVFDAITDWELAALGAAFNLHAEQLLSDDDFKLAISVCRVRMAIFERASNNERENAHRAKWRLP